MGTINNRSTENSSQLAGTKTSGGRRHELTRSVAEIRSRVNNEIKVFSVENKNVLKKK